MADITNSHSWGKLRDNVKNIKFICFQKISTEDKEGSVGLLIKLKS